eukprot:SM000018S03563  [mRNA]  locus=s18:71647:74755:+ [translate_table: standard]
MAGGAAGRRLAAVASHIVAAPQPASSTAADVGDGDAGPCRCDESATALVTPEPRHGHPAVLIGAAVFDVQAAPVAGAELRAGTTTPGTVACLHGGVARNIAECMALMGTTPPLLVSIVGLDAFGYALLAHLESLGMPTRGIKRCRGVSTPVVTAIIGKGGDIMAGVADTRAVESELTSAWVHNFRHDIEAAPVVMVDANLLPSVLETVCNMAARGKTPVWFEPVSVAKAVRAASILHQVSFVSPSQAELVAMAQALQQPELRTPLPSLTSPSAVFPTAAAHAEALEPYIRALLVRGVTYVVTTMGAGGALLSYLRTSCTKGCLLTRQREEAASKASQIGAGGLKELQSRSACCDSNTKAAGGNTPLCDCRGTGDRGTADVAAGRHRCAPAQASDRIQGCIGVTPPAGAVGSHSMNCTRNPGDRHPPASGEELALDSNQAAVPCPQQLQRPSFPNVLQRGRGPESQEIEHRHFPAIQAKVVRVVGAGDSLVAGALTALVEGGSIIGAMAYGLAAAAKTIGSQHNVPSLASLEELRDASREAAASSYIIRIPSPPSSSHVQRN